MMDTLTPVLGTSIEGAFSHSVNGLNSCGSGTMIIFIVLVLSLVFNAFQVISGRMVIRMVLNSLLKREDADETGK